jgi:hypothetical protein
MRSADLAQGTCIRRSAFRRRRHTRSVADQTGLTIGDDHGEPDAIPPVTQQSSVLREVCQHSKTCPGAVHDFNVAA